MTNDTALIVGALAIAAGLVLIPKRPRAASGAAAATGPRTGAGDATTVWDGAASARYREALSRQTAGQDWMGP